MNRSAYPRNITELQWNTGRTMEENYEKTERKTSRSTINDSFSSSCSSRSHFSFLTSFFSSSFNFTKFPFKILLIVLISLSSFVIGDDKIQPHNRQLVNQKYKAYHVTRSMHHVTQITDHVSHRNSRSSSNDRHSSQYPSKTDKHVIWYAQTEPREISDIQGRESLVAPMPHRHKVDDDAEKHSKFYKKPAASAKQKNPTKNRNKTTRVTIVDATDVSSVDCPRTAGIDSETGLESRLSATGTTRMRSETEPTPTCLKKCVAHEDCRGRHRRCLCDGPCGMSCVRFNRRCPTPEPLDDGRVEINPPGGAFNATIRYSCDDGFVRIGQEARVCRGDGRWSGKKPICSTEGYCQDPPPAIHHAYYNASPYSSASLQHHLSRTSRALQEGLGFNGVELYPLGTELLYSCRSGYNLDGYRRAVCVGEGRWFGPRITCTPQSCSHPGDIPNGRRDGSTFRYPEHVTYHCDEGYEIIGETRRHCQASGRWSGQLPSCRPIKCPALYAPSYGHMIGNDFTFGSVLRFGCITGYRLAGESSRRCEHDGTWSGKNVFCILIDCGDPGPFYNGYTDGVKTTYDVTITFHCLGGSAFDLSSKDFESSTIRCTEGGNWSHPVPKCWSECTNPSVTNGMLTGTSLANKFSKHNHSITYECDKGYVPENMDERGPVCWNGTWKYKPNCIPVVTKMRAVAPCTARPPDIKDGMVRFYRTNHGDQARYWCNEGFKMNGTTDSITCFYGTWNWSSASLKHSEPTCEKHDCIHPGDFPNGKILIIGVIGKFEYRTYVKKIGHNDQIEFHCDKDYELVGPSAATCVHGEWSPPFTAKCVLRSHPFMDRLLVLRRFYKYT